MWNIRMEAKETKSSTVPNFIQSETNTHPDQRCHSIVCTKGYTGELHMSWAECEHWRENTPVCKRVLHLLLQSLGAHSAPRQELTSQITHRVAAVALLEPSLLPPRMGAVRKLVESGAGAGPQTQLFHTGCRCPLVGTSQ